MKDVPEFGGSMEVDGITSIREGGYSASLSMFRLKEDYISEEPEGDAHKATDGIFAWLKREYEEYRDLEWDPTITF